MASGNKSGQVDYNQIAQLIFDMEPIWKWAYIVVRPNPFGARYMTEGLSRCYEIKLGDGRHHNLKETYSTYSGNVAAVQFEAPETLTIYLPDYNLNSSTASGIAKMLEGAFFDHVAPQIDGLVRTEWYLLTTKSLADNQKLTNNLKILLDTFKYGKLHKEGSTGGPTLRDLVVAMRNVLLICDVQRSRGVELISP
ncbi:hypothetical protein FS749_000385 [Ceratobasidium sp. UAMH 11750]|nr:hypothetical protein FS749_000385 [Ceratobasidium sp. UAMH 11750]